MSFVPMGLHRRVRQIPGWKPRALTFDTFGAGQEMRTMPAAPAYIRGVDDSNVARDRPPGPPGPPRPLRPQECSRAARAKGQMHAGRSSAARRSLWLCVLACQTILISRIAAAVFLLSATGGTRKAGLLARSYAATLRSNRVTRVCSKGRTSPCGLLPYWAH